MLSKLNRNATLSQIYIFLKPVYSRDRWTQWTQLQNTVDVYAWIMVLQGSTENNFYFALLFVHFCQLLEHTSQQREIERDSSFMMLQARRYQSAVCVYHGDSDCLQGEITCPGRPKTHWAAKQCGHCSDQSFLLSKYRAIFCLLLRQQIASQMQSVSKWVWNACYPKRFKAKLKNTLKSRPTNLRSQQRTSNM